MASIGLQNRLRMHLHQGMPLDIKHFDFFSLRAQNLELFSQDHHVELGEVAQHVHCKIYESTSNCSAVSAVVWKRVTRATCELFDCTNFFLSLSAADTEQ